MADPWHDAGGAEILGEMLAGSTTVPAVVGREADLGALEDALEQARGGDPVTVVVAGEAGIGKTRLVEEFAERAFAQGARVLAGACADLGDAAIPYGPFADALRAVPAAAYANLGPGPRRELAALVPEAGREGDPPLAGTQAGLFGALLRLLEDLGREQPLVLVVEDLHWADRSTLDVLRFLVRGLRQTAVLLVLTHRTDELTREHPVPRLLAELRRRPRVRSHDLRPLTREQTARQLAALAGAPPAGAEVDAIHARAEGNPFFAEELLAAGASEEGRRAGAGGAGAIPATLREALALRLDRLPKPAREAARTAAAIGRRAGHDLLAGLLDDPGDGELDDALRACVAGHVLRVDDARQGYRFRHALLQEVAAGELLPGEARRLHERIAVWLEAEPAPPGTAGAQRLAEIAHHRRRAGEPAGALAATVRAARAAESVHALAEAARDYEAAVEVWDRVPGPEAVAGADLPFLLERAAECRWLGLGDPIGSVALLERAVAALGPEVPAARRADYLSLLAIASWDARANAGAAVPLHEEALALLDPEPTRTAARVRARYANALMLVGDFPGAEAHAAEAAQVARFAHAPAEEADALVTRAVCRSMAGDDVGSLALLEQARAPVLEAADGRLVKRFYTNATHILHSFARYEEAIAVAREGIELHERAGLDRHGQMCVHENAAGALCALGRPAEAAALLGDDEGAFTSDTLCLHIRLAGTALMLGDLDGAATRIARARREAGTEPMIVVPASALQAEVALWRGDLDTARAAVRGGEAVLVEADRLDATRLLAVAVRVQAEAAGAGAVAPETARAEADRLVGRLRRVAAHGQARLPEADALLRAGRAERSRLGPGGPDPDPWRAAAASWQALGRPYEVAYASLRAAHALAVAQAPRDELEGALHVAHDAARRAGSPHLQTEVEALARRVRVALPGAAAEAAVAFPDLTSREREVLALVAEGRTNNQIAEALFITAKTASVHVSNILAKLGAANRGEAAALAHRAGFVPDAGAPA